MEDLSFLVEAQELMDAQDVPTEDRSFWIPVQDSEPTVYGDLLRHIKANLKPE